MVNENKENFGPKIDDLYADYKFGDTVAREPNIDPEQKRSIASSIPGRYGNSLIDTYSVPLSSVRDQVAYCDQTIFDVKQNMENNLLRKLYVNPFVDPDLEQAHARVWKEACKYLDIPEKSEPIVRLDNKDKSTQITTDSSDSENLEEFPIIEDDLSNRTIAKDSLPLYVCFDEYDFALRYGSSAGRRLVSEFHEAIAQSTFSYFFQLRKILDFMLNEVQYIKVLLLNDFGEDYENEQQQQIALKFDSWAKAAVHYTGRITKTVLSRPGEIPNAELDQITKKQAIEFQAFFTIRLNAVEAEINDILNSLKRDLVDNSDTFYMRFLSTALRVNKDIALPLELDFQTTRFLSEKPKLSEELIVATNLLKGNFASVHADTIQRHEAFRAKVDAALMLIHEKRKYANYISQLGNISIEKKQILQPIKEDKYSPLFRSIVINTNRDNNFKSQHAELDDLGGDDHPQYLLKDGGTIEGNIIVKDGITIDGVDLDKHGHTGIDGSTKIKSSDIDYLAAQSRPEDYVVKPLSISIAGFEPDIIEGGVPVFDTIVHIEVDDLAAEGFEYELIHTEVNVSEGAVEQSVSITTATWTSNKMPTIFSDKPYSSQIPISTNYQITYSITSGSLPPGITLNPLTGQISGTTSVSGSYSFTIRATYFNQYIEQNFTVPVILAPEFLYHTKQFEDSSAISNYGKNSDFHPIQKITKYGIDSAYWGFGPFDEVSEDTVPFYSVLGNCEKFQVVLAAERPRKRTNFPQFSHRSGGGFYIVAYNEALDRFSFGEAYCYVQEYYTDNTFFATTLIKMEHYDENKTTEARVYCEYEYPIDDSFDKYTFIFGVDPTVDLTSEIQSEGWGRQPGQIPWPSLINGLVPNGYVDWGSYNFGSNELPVSCSSWMANDPASTSFYGIQEFQNAGKNTMLGIGLYKNLFLDSNQVDYWNKEYNWLENPGFI
jgi:hypothetical protein